MGRDMDQETAWKVVQASFKCGADLQALLLSLKERCTEDAYREYRLAVACAVDAINVQLMDRALTSHPELNARIERELAGGGRIDRPVP